MKAILLVHIVERIYADVIALLPDYLTDASRGSAPGRKTVGLATDCTTSS